MERWHKFFTGFLAELIWIWHTLESYFLHFKDERIPHQAKLQDQIYPLVWNNQNIGGGGGGWGRGIYGVKVCKTQEIRQQRTVDSTTQKTRGTLQIIPADCLTLWQWFAFSQYGAWAGEKNVLGGWSLRSASLWSLPDRLRPLGCVFHQRPQLLEGLFLQSFLVSSITSSLSSSHFS